MLVRFSVTLIRLQHGAILQKLTDFNKTKTESLLYRILYISLYDSITFNTVSYITNFTESICVIHLLISI